MTAFDLIDSIFSRVQPGMPGNMRRITQAQYDYLRNLIDGDPEGGALKPDGPGKMLWTPAGRTKYLLTDGTYGQRALVKMASLTAAATGRLF